MKKRSKIDREPINPDRVRTIGADSFAFIPHRFLQEGYFSSLSQHQLLLYFFLALAGDRNGISFYHFDRIANLLMITSDEYLAARNGLIKKDLIAYDGTRSQLLSLPEHPIDDEIKILDNENDFIDSDPATIRHVIRKSLGYND